MPWTIYCHTHVDSGRRYIGLTKKTMLQRWNQHVYIANRVVNGRHHFPNAIRKYGKYAFTHQILESNIQTLEEANLAEEAWIDSFSTCDPEFGFNLVKGGDHVPHPKKRNPWNNPEFRAKMLTIGKEQSKNPAFLLAMANSSRKLQNDPEFISKIKSPEFALIHHNNSMNLWKNPDFRKKTQKVSKKPENFVRKTKTLGEVEPNKVCSLCKKPGEFGRDKHTPSGLKYKCKTCEKDLRSIDKEKHAMRSKIYLSNSKNKENRVKYMSSYFIKNKQYISDRDSSRRDDINKRSALRKKQAIDHVWKKKLSPCKLCGGIFHPDKMDFYYPGLNVKSIRWLINHGLSFEKLEKEISNRKLLCFSCFNMETRKDMSMLIHEKI